MTEQMRQIRLASYVYVGEVIELDDHQRWVVVAVEADPAALWTLRDSEGIPEYGPESVLASVRALK